MVTPKTLAQQGFTLAELVIVIILIGVLASVVLVAINPLQKINQAKDANVKSDITQLAQDYETFRVAFGTYPWVMNELVLRNELSRLPRPPANLSYTNYQNAFPDGFIPMYTCGLQSNPYTPCTDYEIWYPLFAKAGGAQAYYCVDNHKPAEVTTTPIHPTDTQCP